MILTVRPASLDDAVGMASRLRPEDAREVETASGMACHQVVPLSVAVARESYTIRLEQHGRIDRDPTVLFGIADDGKRPGFGVMWLVATPEISRAPLSILREAKYWIEAWTQQYPNGIHNIVDTRNLTHIRWLSILGFRMSEQTIDINGSPFRYAWRDQRK